MSILSCNHLSLSYGSVPVIQDVTFAIPAGAYFAIIGENGSGKSTLFKGLLGLLQPREGTVEFAPEVGDRIGYLPQLDHIPQHFPASVKEVVSSGALNHGKLFGFLSYRDQEKVEDVLDRLNMLSFLNRPFKTLSGGQRRRVLIARALMASTKIIFLDEPAAGLDPQAEAEFYKLLAKLNQNDDLTIVTISHQFEAIRTYADHLLVMEHGRSIFFGRPDLYPVNQGGQG